MYTFIKTTEQNENTPNSIFVTKNEIEYMPLTDTYDNNGQLVDHYTAGAVITLLTPKAFEFAQQSEDQLDIEEIIDNKELKEDVDYSITVEGLKGFNFFNGNNWQTICVKLDYSDNNPYKIIEDENYTEEILNKEFLKEENGVKWHESENFWIRQSLFASNPWTYEMYSKEDYENIESIF